MTPPNSTSYHAAVGGSNSNGGRTQARINSDQPTQPSMSLGDLYDITFGAPGNHLPGRGPTFTSTISTSNPTSGIEFDRGGGRTQARNNNNPPSHPPMSLGDLYDATFGVPGREGPSTSIPITTTIAREELEESTLMSNEQTNDNQATNNAIINNNNDNEDIDNDNDDGNSTNDCDGSTVIMNSTSNSNDSNSNSNSIEPTINLETLGYCPPATADQSNNIGTTLENNNDNSGSIVPFEELAVSTMSDNINNHDQHQQNISSNTSESTQPTSDQASYIATFAAKLKTIENGIIVDFDVALLKSTCMMKISPTYDSTVDIALLASELFKCGETWMNRDLLLASVRAYR